MLRRIAHAVAVLAAAAGAGRAQTPTGAEFQVNTFTTNRQYDPVVAAAADGTFTVVWTNYAQIEVLAQRFDARGQRLGGEFAVATRGYGFGPDIAADPSGAFMVAWNAPDDDTIGIVARVFDAGGNPSGPEFQVNAYVTSYQFNPAVAHVPGGNFVVVWQHYGDPGGEYVSVMARLFDGTGAPLTGDFQANVFSTGRQLRPAAVGQPGGAFVVVWVDDTQDGSYTGVFGRLFDAGGQPVAGEFQVNTTTLYEQDSPDVAVDAAGNFVVVWDSFGQDGHDYGIVARLFDASGKPLGPEFQVNTYTTYRQYRPSVVREPGGHFVVTWTSTGPLGLDAVTEIVGQRFRPDGARVGGEFLVNTYTTGGQLQSSVASQGAGTFVIVWTSPGPDGDGEGVFGRRFGDLIFRDGFEP
jgi:hypothetical protein